MLSFYATATAATVLPVVAVRAAVVSPTLPPAVVTPVTIHVPVHSSYFHVFYLGSTRRWSAKTWWGKQEQQQQHQMHMFINNSASVVPRQIGWAIT
jgi:hypothetical protein